jgi:hypothetical protein
MRHINAQMFKVTELEQLHGSLHRPA